MNRQLKRVAVAGMGAVGMTLSKALIDGIDGYELAAVSARRTERAVATLEGWGSSVPVLPLVDLAEVADIVIECVPSAVFGELVSAAVDRGRDVVVLSSGALLDHWELVARAAETGATIRVPSGALLALDAVQAAAVGTIESVSMITRKPVEGLVGAPFFDGSAIDLGSVSDPERIFQGSVREAIAGFPANLNVAVALSLAGIGPDRTTLEVWADPSVTRNTHDIVVESDSARLTFRIENIPTDNARTGKITALSVIALLKKLANPLQIGT